MKKVLVGKIVNTFGIKGELKVTSLFEMPEKAFKKDNKIFINNKEHLITNVRFHKNNYLVEIDNIKDINDVLIYKGYNVYLYYQDLKLDEKEYLLDDLIGLEVYENENLIGKVTSVTGGINPLIKVNDQFYIPLNADFILTKDFVNNKIICQDLEGLML